MSFVFVENHPFEWPVKVQVPVGGSYETVEITGLFEIMDDAAFLSPGEGITSVSAGIDLEIDRLMEVFKGWKEGDVLTPEKQNLPPTPANIRKFLSQRPARPASSA